MIPTSNYQKVKLAVANKLNDILSPDFMVCVKRLRVVEAKRVYDSKCPHCRDQEAA